VLFSERYRLKVAASVSLAVTHRMKIDPLACRTPVKLVSHRSKRPLSESCHHDRQQAHDRDPMAETPGRKRELDGG
jgi:hypothetical protein